MKVFGLATHSLGTFTSQYTKYLKQRNKPIPTVAFVPAYHVAHPKQADIYLVQSIKNALILVSNLPENSVVVISDSPILLNEIENIVALDWDKQNSFTFNLKDIDFQTFERIRNRKAGTNTQLEKINQVSRLGLVIEKTSPGVILNDLNALIGEMNPHHKQVVRDCIGEAFVIGPTKVKATLINLIKKSGIELNNKLKQTLFNRVVTLLDRHSDTILQFSEDYINKKSINKYTKSTDFSLYEIRYLANLIKARKTVKQ